jgi:hypothetical protein
MCCWVRIWGSGNKRAGPTGVIRKRACGMDPVYMVWFEPSPSRISAQRVGKNKNRTKQTQRWRENPRSGVGVVHGTCICIWHALHLITRKFAIAF